MPCRTVFRHLGDVLLFTTNPATRRLTNLWRLAIFFLHNSESCRDRRYLTLHYQRLAAGIILSSASFRTILTTAWRLANLYIIGHDPFHLILTNLSILNWAYSRFAAIGRKLLTKATVLAAYTHFQPLKLRLHPVFSVPHSQ